MKQFTKYLSIFTLALAFSLPLQANAQDAAFSHKDDAWWNKLELQLTKSLERSVDQVQDETLQHIVFFATNYEDKVQLGHLAPKLLDMYKTEKNDARRTMAVMALHAIGNKHSMNRLARLAQNEPPGSLRNITMAVIADYKTNS